MIEWLDLFVTDSCNLKCSYCFHKTSGNFLSIQDSFAYISDLYEEMSNDCIINFFGGEPLLNTECIRAVVDHCKTLDKKFRFSLSTNGTLFEKDFFKFAFDNNFGVQISIDGCRDTQNAYRGEYDLIISNIEKIKSIGVKISARMTYDTSSISDLAKNVKHIHSLGIDRVMHQAVICNDWDESSVNKYDDQYREIAEFYSKNRDCSSSFLNKSKLNVESKLSSPTCKAGKTLIAVDVDGTVYPCHRFASNGNYRLGTTKLFHRGIFDRVSRKDMAGCSSCAAKQTCHSCMAANYEVNGSITENVSNHCNLIRRENSLMKSDAPNRTKDKIDILEEKVDNILSLLVNLCKVELERCK